MFIKQLCFFGVLLISCNVHTEPKERLSNAQEIVEKQTKMSDDEKVVTYSSELKENSQRQKKVYSASCRKGIGFVLLGVANLILGLISISQW